MSKGSFIAYHQRPNKSVERQLFIDLITRVNRFAPVSDYNYISFGGAYFEDFKLIHSHFNNQNMISIESDKTVFARQLFNRPFACIKLENKSSDEFINDYSSEHNSMFWLDYAEAQKHREQLDEFRELLTKIIVGDIVKITLNANVSSLFDGSQKKNENENYSSEELNQIRLEKLTEKIEEYLPNNLTPLDLRKDQYPKVLNSAIGIVASKAMQERGEGEIFQPLTSFYYADSGNQMMTTTGIILKNKDLKDFFRITNLKKWPLASYRWGNAIKINLPNLTAKEKFAIDQLLPCKNTDKIIKKLGFKFAKKEDENKEILEGYMKYYRHYPSYHKINY